MSQTDTLANARLYKTDRAVPRAFTSLIEVPDARRQPRRWHRPRDLGQRDRARAVRSRAKRRVRRELRVAGSVLLAIAPLFAAYTLGRPGLPARVVACSIAEATAPIPVTARAGDSGDALRQPLDSPVGSPAVVVLSSGAAAPTGGADSEIPVIFPGYVLPDDSLEESTHEGS